MTSDSAPDPASDPAPSAPADAVYRDGAVDLLGVLAYGELTAFERLAEDARLAPSLADKVHMVSMAAIQYDDFATLRGRLSDLGADVMVAMEPFHAPLDAFHEHTRPSDWFEGLVKAYVGDGFAADFYREIAAFVDDDTRTVVHDALGDGGHSEFVVEQVRAGIANRPEIGGRLALWGRRLVGEALSQAQRVAADRDALTSLLAGTVERPGLDLAALSLMFSRLIENHTERMRRLGLQS